MAVCFFSPVQAKRLFFVCSPLYFRWIAVSAADLGMYKDTMKCSMGKKKPRFFVAEKKLIDKRGEQHNTHFAFAVGGAVK